MLEFPIVGLWKPGQISISWTENSRPIIPQVEALIEQAWQKARSRPGIHLFDGPMCRLEAIDARPDRMHLTLSKSSYKPFVGTNMSNPQIADQYGNAALANPVGLSALVISSDDYLLLGRRNAHVAYYPSRVHPFAGCLEPAENLDIFDDVRRELAEELSIEPQEISEMLCTGVARDLSLRQPEFIFAVRVNRTLKEIEAQVDPEEHRGIFNTRSDRKAIEAALSQNDGFTPVGSASLLLWGRMQYGNQWFDANCVTKFIAKPA